MKPYFFSLVFRKSLNESFLTKFYSTQCEPKTLLHIKLSLCEEKFGHAVKFDVHLAFDPTFPCWRLFPLNTSPLRKVKYVCSYPRQYRSSRREATGSPSINNDLSVVRRTATMKSYWSIENREAPPVWIQNNHRVCLDEGGRTHDFRSPPQRGWGWGTEGKTNFSLHAKLDLNLYHVSLLQTPSYYNSNIFYFLHNFPSGGYKILS